MAGTYRLYSLCAVLCGVYFTESVHLDDYIRHYEELNYDTRAVHEAHLRHKRSIDDTLHMNINAFDRTFHLRLQRDTTIFEPEYKHEAAPGKLVDRDVSFIYSGHVQDIAGSRVHGAIIEGSFHGTIQLPGERETYHIEKSWRFFPDDPVFHSVIYRESDMVLDPYKERRAQEHRDTLDPGMCGNSKARSWMREVVASEVLPENRPKRSTMEWQEVMGGHNKYTETVNMAENEHKRVRRDVIGENNTCNLYLRSDIMFWNHFAEGKSAGEEELTKDEILAFFASHVNAINQIYENTNFATYDNRISYSGVKFVVSRTLVLTPDDGNDSNYQRFYSDHLDVSNFLNLNSLDNHDEFCLAYMFTYRDFNAGTLGLAWVASPGKPSGGICERYKKFQEGPTDKKVWKSLNTGIVSTLNYGKAVPSKVSQLTFGHEVGHNFGSPHDTGAECAPYGTSNADAAKGNYIMFASATMGDRPNNNRFSVCSKDNITRVLEVILSNQKPNCFKKSGPFCGNNIVEAGEQCDCGYSDQCRDQCCIGRSTDSANPNPDMCQRPNTVVCSPSEGPCCTDNCTFVGSSAAKTCRYLQDCAEQATCTDGSAVCPQSVFKANGTYCNNHGFTCVAGECAGSLCEKFGWTECFLTGDMSILSEQKRLCTLGCQQNATSPCILSSDADKLTKYTNYSAMVSAVIAGRGTDLEDGGVQLAPGSPCNNLRGYCDVFFRCRGVDADGPLARLKHLIFNPETLETVKDWIVENWWAVLLMAIGLVLAMGLFIKFCAVHTPSSNPKAKPARKLSETMTLRRRRNQHQQQQQAQPNNPQQVRYPQNPHGPPPPYPGSSNMAEGPPHGHGKKGKGRKGRDLELGRI